jgi:hypothetical protein
MPIGAGSSLHFLIGPAIAFLAVGGLALFLRWAFGTGDQRWHPGMPVEDGQLALIATLSGLESAHALRAVLSDAGIQSTMRFPPAHGVEILVFPEDAPRARALAASFPGP